MKINKLLLIPILLLSAIAKLSAAEFCESYGEYTIEPSNFNTFKKEAFFFAIDRPKEIYK